jgi:hypothetical protein
MHDSKATREYMIEMYYAGNLNMRQVRIAAKLNEAYSLQEIVKIDDAQNLQITK